MNSKRVMSKFRVVIFIAIIAIATAAYGSKKADSLSIIGTLSYETPYGKTVKLSHEKGRVLVLNYFATWCPPCKAETPDLVNLYKKYHKQGLDIIGISIDQDINNVPPFVKKYDIPYKIVLQNQQSKTIFGVMRYIPTSIIINRKGKIYKRFVGIMPQIAWESTIQKLLKENK